MSSFTCLRTLEGHTSSVLKLHFVSRGTQLVSAGSDGLLKLWAVRGSECVCTIDAHEDKVWALDVSEGAAGCELISGSADSVLVRWRDCTAAAEAAASAESQLKNEQQQQLSNAVRIGKHAEALRLALALTQPRALRDVVEAMMALPDADELLQDGVAELPADGVAHVLRCVRDWNSSARFALVGQRLLHALLKTRPLAQLAATPHVQVRG